MRRYVIAIPLFSVTFLLGLWIYFIQPPLNPNAGVRDTLEDLTSQLWFHISEVFIVFSKNSPLLFEPEEYKGLLLFGGVALFGITMAMLAIRVATKSWLKVSKIQSPVSDPTREKERVENLVSGHRHD